MRFLLTAIVGILVPLGASADPGATAQRFADEFAIPRFRAVAVAAHVQGNAWSRFCAAPSHGDAGALKTAFDAVADAWADVEFVHIGPAAVALRAERFNWWLDRTDATGKALGAMLASDDPQSLTPDKLASGSVAGQGLPVLERLLYAPDAIAQLESGSGARRCAVGMAVAKGQAVIADAIVNDWTAPNGARAALAAGTRWNVAFANAGEAANVMLTDLASGLEGLKDFQVAMLFHDAANPGAPRLAEAALSGRTARDIARNLAAIREGLGIFLVAAPPSDKYRLDAAFDDAQNALTSAGRPDLPQRERVAALQLALAAFASLAQTARDVLPEATGLTLGFNNLDGD